MIMHKTCENLLWFIKDDKILYECYGIDNSDIAVWLENQEIELTWLTLVGLNYLPFNF